MRNSFTLWPATDGHQHTNATALRQMLCCAALILCAISLSAQNHPLSAAGSNSQVAAQPEGDLATLLQKVVDLPELQAYYPLDTDKRVKPLVVMQHGVSFPVSIPVAHHSKPLIFKSKQEVIQETAYFLFWRFDIAADKARLEFSYIYNAGSSRPSAQKVELVFDKTDKNWTITSSNIQKVQL